MDHNLVLIPLVLFGQAEITNLNCVTIPQKDVHCFDISMEDEPFMEKMYPKTNLDEKVHYKFLWDLLLVDFEVSYEFL